MENKIGGLEKHVSLKNVLGDQKKIKQTVSQTVALLKPQLINIYIYKSITSNMSH